MTVQFKFLSEKYRNIKQENLVNISPIIPEDLDHLIYIVRKQIKLKGNECDLNHIDVSQITEMIGLFEDLEFNGNISKWNVSKVINMSHMFKNCDFNGDISKWDVSNVQSMAQMFYGSKFNNDISKWIVSEVLNMNQMFLGCAFNGDISEWDVSKVTHMTQMFVSSLFTGDISNWEPYSLKKIYSLLGDSPINQPYWLKYEDREERNKAIDSYHLQKELNRDLTINDTQKKKTKI
jgi:surface protein